MAMGSVPHQRHSAHILAAATPSTTMLRSSFSLSNTLAALPLLSLRHQYRFPPVFLAIPLPFPPLSLSSPSLLHSTPPYTAVVAIADIPVASSDKVAKQPQWKAAIDFKWIRDNQEAVAANIRNRNSRADLDLVLHLYDKMLTLQKSKGVEQLRAERNTVANKMEGKLEPSGRQKLIEEGKNLKDGLVSLEEDLVRVSDELQQEAQSIPNMTHPEVPLGAEDCSALRKTAGSRHEFSFPIKDNFQLGKELDLFDFDAAAEGSLYGARFYCLFTRVSGSKFHYLKNAAVMLEMALINWTLSQVTRRGFTPLTTPEIVRSSVIEKCGFQPCAENTQVYSIESTDQCLIGTAEIPIGGIHMDSILPEAGAAGTATRVRLATPAI